MRFLRLFRPSPHAAPAAALYAAIVTQSRQPAFYDAGVADTLDGRFDLLCLHAFLLLRRLRRDGQDLGQALFDLMFADLERGLRETGVSDYSIGHKMKDLAAAFYGRIQAYEETLADPTALAGALARNLFRGQVVAGVTLDRLVRYTAEAAAALDGQPSAELAAGRVRFPSFAVPVTGHV